MAASLLLSTATVADAKWLRAESKNFILYSDGTEAEVKTQAEKLEKFAFVLRAVSNRKVAESPVKLKVYQVGDLSDLNAVLDGYGGGTLAYYVRHVRGAYVVAPERAEKVDPRLARRSSVQEMVFTGDDSMYHEITHHFMYQYFPGAYPTWYSEGFAEFYGSFNIDENSKVLLGKPQKGRIENLGYGEWLPVEKLLKGRSYADFGSNIGLLYAEGWLLVHYADGNPIRGPQLKQYLTDINAGKPFAKAAEAFGDLKLLDNELRNYARRNTMDQRAFAFKAIDPGPVKIEAMSPAEVALWKLDADITGGVRQADAARFATRVRAAAAPFPNDPYALRMLTEVETMSDDRVKAAAALSRWLAAKPQDPLALMFKANAELAALKEQKVPAGDPRWDAARQGLLTANKLAKQEPRIHVAIYNSFETEGVMAPAYAQSALAFAHRVSPSDNALRKKVAVDYEKRGMIAEAIATVRPAAVMLKSQEEMTEKEKSDREKGRAMALKDPDKYRRAGEPLDLESARDVLDRLEKKKAAAGGTATPVASTGQ
ncbi:MAG: hypothetical protein V4659_05495 [Pseudomonadota bacterium]